MTNEQAKSELMQLYGSLSEEKKMALDVLMAQADGKYINIQDAISEIREMAKWHTGDAFNADRVIQHLKQLSSVAIPSAEQKKCKDCKWWRDSDGAYRRGVKAESKCPINTVSVANGWGYCYMFEEQERSKE